MTPTERIRKIVRGYYDLANEILPADILQPMRSLSPRKQIEWLARRASEDGFVSRPQSGRVAMQRRESGVYAPRVNFSNAFEIHFDRLISAVGRYWDANGPDLLKALLEEDAYAIAITMRGDPGTQLPRTVRRLAIYFDSIVLVDPLYIPASRRDDLMNSPEFTGQRLVLAQRFQYVLQLEEAARADAGKSIVVIIPDYLGIDTDPELARKYVSQVTRRTDATDVPHDGSYTPTIEFDESSPLFGRLRRRFGPQEEGEGLKITVLDDGTWDKTSISVLENGSMLRGPAHDAIESLARTIDESFYTFRETIGNATAIGADPVFDIIDDFLLDWFRQEVLPAAPSYVETGPVASALLSNRTDFLEALSIDALKRIRSEGMFEDLRRQLRVDRAELRGGIVLPAREYEQRFLKRLFEVFAEFNKEAITMKASHRKEVRKGVLGVSVSVGIGALSLLVPPVAALQVLMAGGGVIAGGKTVTDLVGTLRRHKREDSEMANSAVGLLFGMYRRR